MCGLWMTRWRVRFLAFDIFKVFSLHIWKSLVFKQHVVHKLIPFNTSIWVGVNLHEKLVKLFIWHFFADNIFKRSKKLKMLVLFVFAYFFLVKRVSIVSISSFEFFTQLHNVLKINALRCILLFFLLFFLFLVQVLL